LKTTGAARALNGPRPESDKRLDGPIAQAHWPGRMKSAKKFSKGN
jgi:hypothetical protein